MSIVTFKLWRYISSHDFAWKLANLLEIVVNFVNLAKLLKINGTYFLLSFLWHNTPYWNIGHQKLQSYNRLLIFLKNAMNKVRFTRLWNKSDFRLITLAKKKNSTYLPFILLHIFLIGRKEKVKYSPSYNNQ